MLLGQIAISMLIAGKTVRGHDNLEQTAGVNADLVFLGSSRCWSHFNPAFFDSAFNIKSVNIGVDGHSELMMSKLRLLDYLSRNKAPKTAILSFDFFFVGGEAINKSEFIHKNDFARYAFLPSTLDRPIVDYFGYTISEKYIPLYAIFKYKLFNDCISRKNIDNWATYGYSMHEQQWDTISNPVSNMLQPARATESQNLIHVLNDLNQICKKNEIKLICIQTPVYKVYDSRLLSRADSICKVLAIPFIDTNTDDIRNDFSNFYNANHINTKGVDKMNQYLKQNEKLKMLLAR